MYTDGDSEDLSLQDLKKLAISYPRSMTIELATQQYSEVKKSANKKIEKSADDHIHVNKSDFIDNHINATIDWNNMDEVDEFEKASELLPPIDAAAEATINTSGHEVNKKKKDSTKDVLSRHEHWLEEVATGLLKSTKSFKSTKRRVGSHKEEEGQDVCTKQISLSDVKRGDRHGCKVVNSKLAVNRKCIVGEVS